MNDKKYVVSEEELKELINNCWKDIEKGEPQYDYIADFLKSKQEVELVAEGVLGYSFNGYTIDKKLISDISYEKIGGGLHKNIKIYISKE